MSDKLSKLLKRGIESPDDEAIEDESKLGFLISQELTPEREEEMIDQLAMHIKRMKMETLAILMLNMFKPVSTVVGQVYGFYLAPFMEIFGIRGYDYAFLLRRKKNVKKLLVKIEEKDIEI